MVASVETKCTIIAQRESSFSLKESHALKGASTSVCSEVVDGHLR